MQGGRADDGVLSLIFVKVRPLLLLRFPPPKHDLGLGALLPGGFTIFSGEDQANRLSEYLGAVGSPYAKNALIFRHPAGGRQLPFDRPAAVAVVQVLPNGEGVRAGGRPHPELP